MMLFERQNTVSPDAAGAPELPSKHGAAPAAGPLPFWRENARVA
jgi:hypothetical protein